LEPVPAKGEPALPPLFPPSPLLAACRQGRAPASPGAKQVPEPSYSGANGVMPHNHGARVRWEPKLSVFGDELIRTAMRRCRFACSKRWCCWSCSSAQEPLTPTRRGCPEGQGWTKLLSSLARVCHRNDFNFACVMCMFRRQVAKFCACPYFPSLLYALGTLSCSPARDDPLLLSISTSDGCRHAKSRLDTKHGSQGAKEVVPAVTRHLPLRPRRATEIYDGSGKHKM